MNYFALFAFFAVQMGGRVVLIPVLEPLFSRLSR